MRNITPTIHQWNEEIFQLLYQYYQGVSNMSNSGTFNIKGVLEYIRKILFNKKFNIPNEDAMKSSVLEGMTTFKQDSYNAFKAFKDSIEMYIEIAMYSIQLLDKKEIVSNSLSIGKCNNRLLEALQERCRLSESEIRKLGYFIEEGETWRNIWHHNTPPREDTDIHKKGCQIALEYLFAVSAICRRIEMARGGIRFTADITCSLDFQNGGQNRSFTYVDVNTPLQIEGKAGEYTLRITINDKNGAKTFTREGIIKSNQYNDEVLQKDSRTHKKNKIRIAPIFNLGNDALDGIPWKRGNYQGAVDTEGQPHGIGTYIQENKKFGGRFQHGEPQGIFKVSCPEFEYKGTIIANNNSPWDLCEGEMEMYDSKEVKFIGRFKDFCCVEGKLLIANKISYEGTFKTINGQTTISGYGTLYLPDHFIYRGEVFNGAPHGKGCLVDEQVLEATYTDWYMGESIADELRELHIKGNEPVKLYDNNIFLCDITLKGICLNYSVEKLNLVIENDGGDTLLYSNNLLQKESWEYNIKYTLEVYKSENGTYGLKNKKGEIVISPYYDYIDLYYYENTDLILVGKNLLEGCINKNNDIIIPIIYDSIFIENNYIDAVVTTSTQELTHLLDFNGNHIINPFEGVLITFDNKTERFKPIRTEIKDEEFYGCIDVVKRKIIIDTVYEEIEYISEEDGFRVKLNEKYGYINVKGEIIIPIEYSFLDPNGWSDDLLLARDSEGKVGYLTRDNVPLFFGEYSSCSRFYEGLASVKYKQHFCFKNKQTNKNELNKKYKYPNKYYKEGFINTKGEIVIPCIFDSCDRFKNGFANVVYKGVPIRISKNYAEPEIIKGDNGKFGLKNKEGKVFTSFIYDKIYKVSENVFKVILNGFNGLIDYEGNILLKTQYKDLNVKGNMCFVREGYKWKALDYGNLKEAFDDVALTDNTCFFGKKNNIWNLYDYDAVENTYKKILFDYQLASIQVESRKGLALVKRNNKYGFINIKERRESIVCKYDDVALPTHLCMVPTYGDNTEYASVKSEGKWGIINHKGEVVLIFDDYLFHSSNNRLFYFYSICITQKNGKYGVIFVKGSICSVIVPFIYDLIEDAQYQQYRFLLAKKDDKYGAFNTEGKILIPFSFTKKSDVLEAFSKLHHTA